MLSKNSLDKLLYQYAEKSLEDKYNDEITIYYGKISKNNIQMDTSFSEFWQNKDTFQKKTTIKRKKKRNTRLIIAASIVFSVLLIGPTKIATYAKEMYNKILTVLDDRHEIEYNNVKPSPITPLEPSYLPDNYTISEKSIDDNALIITYSNGNIEEDIFFDIFPLHGTGLSLDTENSKIYTINLKNRTINCIENNKMNLLYWENDTQVYTISGKIKTEELIKMAESILNQKGA